MNKIFADFQFDTCDCFNTHRKLAWIWDPNVLRVCVCVTRKKIYLFVHLINSFVNRLVPLRLYIVRIEWIAGSCRFLIYERTSVFMDFHSVPWPHSMSAFIYLLSVCLCWLSRSVSLHWECVCVLCTGNTCIGFSFWGLLHMYFAFALHVTEQLNIQLL